MFKKLKNIDVLIIDWESMKNKIFMIIAILFFAGFTIGFCVGCGVENSIPTPTKNGLSENFLQKNLSGVYLAEVLK